MFTFGSHKSSCYNLQGNRDDPFIYQRCYNMRMRPIATDIASFEELRKAGQIYVDKTAYFHRLITDSKPRQLADGEAVEL